MLILAHTWSKIIIGTLVLLAFFELWGDIRLESVADVEVLFVLKSFPIYLLVLSRLQLLNRQFQITLNRLSLFELAFKLFNLILGRVQLTSEKFNSLFIRFNRDQSVT